MRKKPSELSDHTGYWLRAVSNHVSHAFARKLADKEVTVAEWVMLRLLFGVEAISPTKLAEMIGMTKGGITKLAERLIVKGMITRQPSRDDGRAQSLRITPKGRALVPQLAMLADQNDAELFGLLSRSDRDTLNQILRKLGEQGGIVGVPTE